MLPRCTFPTECTYDWNSSQDGRGIYRKGYFTGCIWKCEFLSAPICEAFYGEGNHRGQIENGNNLSYDETIHRLIEREKIDQDQRNILVSHQFYLPVGKTAEDVERMDSEIRTVGNIDEISAGYTGTV